MDERELRVQFEKLYLQMGYKPTWNENELQYINLVVRCAWDGFVRCAILNKIVDDSVILSYNGGIGS